ncbi:hypothetical protein ACFPME_17350 [Rhodanobacter umsongensis]|uniref:Uncharacterized protein n=1 Tax=Rhodanobacter umsongensis TaxID=633153 RepID=A0ABW0JR67_9GAMM
MNRFLQRALMAYRPLYLNGLLLDGRYQLPKTGLPGDPVEPVRSPRSRQRALLAALVSTIPRQRSQS